jgi:hypothetical protein
MDELDQWIKEGALAAPCLESVKAILDADVHEDEMADMLRAFMHANVTTIEDAAVVSDMLQATGIISKYFFRRLYEWRGCTSERR